MGVVFGRTGSKEPPYKVIFQSSNYSIRKYDSMRTAEIIQTHDNDSNNSFRALARYIGVYGSAENLLNNQAIPIPMTVPVLVRTARTPVRPDETSLQEPIPSLVVRDPAPPVRHTRETIMSLVLPSQYSSVSREEVPTPLNSDIIISEVPGKLVAVKTFSGYCSSEVSEAVCRRFYRDLVVQHASQFLVPSAMMAVSAGGSRECLDTFQWHVAQYHPPFTLPFLRKNEIWIEMDPDREDSLVAAALQASA